MVKYKIVLTFPFVQGMNLEEIVSCLGQHVQTENKSRKTHILFYSESVFGKTKRRLV